MGEEYTDEFQKFRREVNNITHFYGRTWINCTIKNLIYNLFKELCIPSMTPACSINKCMDFLGISSFLNDPDVLKDITIYQCADRIFDDLCTQYDIPSVKEYRKYIQWLEKNSTQIKKYERNEPSTNLQIQVKESTEIFVKNLLELYLKVNLPFPFYNFSFGVSTGEYCFLSIFSNLYSIYKEKSQNQNTRDANAESMLLIFDEVDLSLHPRWQRMFMKWLTDFCGNLFREISLKIIVTTHSPILLSDFPGNSVLYLEPCKNICSCKAEQRKTFGCNIHSLFLNSFFLEDEGTMGAFAEEKINRIAKDLSDSTIDEEKLERIEGIIDYIGEGIIKDQLKVILKEKKKLSAVVTDEAEIKVIQDTIYKLKSQKRQLEELIVSLEEKIYDKN